MPLSAPAPVALHAGPRSAKSAVATVAFVCANSAALPCLLFLSSLFPQPFLLPLPFPPLVSLRFRPMADQVNHETPEGFFLTEEEEAALATALSTTDVAQTASVSATSETLLSPGGAWAVPDSAPTENTPPVQGPDSGSGSSSGWAPPGDYYQAPQSSFGNQWSGYGPFSPVPVPSVLVRPGASDGQLLDGLSLLSPDVRHRLLSLLNTMEHRPNGQPCVVLAAPPGPPPHAVPQSRPGRNTVPDPAPKRRAFPEPQDFCTIACRVPGCDRLCGRPLTPRGHRNHVCRRCHRHR